MELRNMAALLEKETVIVYTNCKFCQKERCI